MNLLFVGDIVGKEGSAFFAKKIFSLKKQYHIDLTVVNGENSASGNGLTRPSAEFLFRNGADVITTGNHAFRRREAVDLYQEEACLLRPANYPDGVAGHGVCLVDLGGYQFAVINLMGVVYMEPIDNPFTCVDALLKQISTPNILVDFHAEATAEKKSMGFYLAGRVSAVLGTHTHVQTADETILNGHTGYLTDTGMTGPESSVLGVKTEIAVEKMRTHYPARFTESPNPCFLNAAVLSIDEKLGKCTNIERVILR